MQHHVLLVFSDGADCFLKTGFTKEQSQTVHVDSYYLNHLSDFEPPNDIKL